MTHHKLYRRLDVGGGKYDLRPIIIIYTTNIRNTFRSIAHFILLFVLLYNWIARVTGVWTYLANKLI